ncbi:hypothetical protein BH10BAC2_BH10BAC2_35980 [soil metagenome]
MKNTTSTDNALLHKPGLEQNDENINSDNKVVNEQEQQQVTNDDPKEDKDKQYDEINKDRSWKGGKEEEINADSKDKQTDNPE